MDQETFDYIYKLSDDLYESTKVTWCVDGQDQEADPEEEGK